MAKAKTKGGLKGEHTLFILESPLPNIKINSIVYSNDIAGVIVSHTYNEETLETDSFWAVPINETEAFCELREFTEITIYNPVNKNIIT